MCLDEVKTLWTLLAALKNVSTRRPTCLCLRREGAIVPAGQVRTVPVLPKRGAVRRRGSSAHQRESSRRCLRKCRSYRKTEQRCPAYKCPCRLKEALLVSAGICLSVLRSFSTRVFASPYPARRAFRAVPYVLGRPAVFCEGVSPKKKSQVKIGEPSHTSTRFFATRFFQMPARGRGGKSEGAKNTTHFQTEAHDFSRRDFSRCLCDSG